MSMTPVATNPTVGPKPLPVIPSQNPPKPAAVSSSPSIPANVPLTPPATDQLQLSGGAPQATSSPHFAGDKNKDGFSFLRMARKTIAAGLGVASGIGLAVGVPLGGIQLLASFFFPPLLYTGALTIGVPAAGLLAAYMLGRK